MIEERLSLAQELVHRAGSLLRGGYGQVSQIHHKGAVDLVTEFDLRAERLLVEGILTAFPQDAIMAEEGGVYNHGNGCWLIDPLDGTTNFAHGVPIFSISIAYLQDEHTHFGVIYDPMRDECFHAIKGQGAWLGNEKLCVSNIAGLNESLLVTGFPYDLRSNADNNLEQFNTLALRSHGVRRLGSAAIDLAYVAAGRLEGFWELRSHPWDIGAGVLMVCEAGGKASRVDGGEIAYNGLTSVVASNGHIHDELLAALQSVKRQPSN